VPNVGLAAQESDIPDVSHIEAGVRRAMLKTSYLRLRIADSSAATAFAMCFSVCAAVTTSLRYSRDTFKLCNLAMSHLELGRLVKATPYSA